MLGLIENPIINSPHREPSRHDRFDGEGFTEEIVEKRQTLEELPLGPRRLDTNL